MKVARSSLELAESELQLVQIRLDRLTIRSPTNGVVLKRYVEPGEFTVGGHVHRSGRDVGIAAVDYGGGRLDGPVSAPVAHSALSRILA